MKFELFLQVCCVLGLVHVKLVLSSCKEPNPARSLCLRGKDGISCGSSKCIEGEACCVRGKCRCQRSTSSGDGGLCCWDSNVYDGGFISSDSNVRTMSNEDVHSPFPCRYLVSHARTDLRVKVKNQVEKQGVCVFHIHAWNTKFGDQFAVEGVDIAVRAEFNKDLCGRSNKVKATFRIKGEAKNGRYVFTEWGEKEYKEDGTFNPEIVKVKQNGVSFQIEFDKKQNFVFFKSIECGVEWRFRPHDEALGANQKYHEGLCVKIKKEHKPRYRSTNHAMLLNPNTELSEWKIPGLDKHKSFFTTAWFPFVAQTHPCASKYCHIALNDLNAPVDQFGAITRRCCWNYFSKPFIRQNDKTRNSDLLLLISVKCVTAFVSPKTCPSFRKFLINKISYDNRPRIPELDKWRRGDYCYKRSYYKY